MVAREEAGGKALVAYVVPRAGESSCPRTCASTCGRSCREHMLPSRLIALAGAAAQPPTARWTAGRSPRGPPVEAAGAAGLTLPRTLLEERLAEIWSEVLGGARVGVHDDFFALGGHSLLAIRVLARIQRGAGHRGVDDRPVRRADRGRAGGAPGDRPSRGRRGGGAAAGVAGAPPCPPALRSARGAAAHAAGGAAGGDLARGARRRAAWASTTTSSISAAIPCWPTG